MSPRINTEKLKEQRRKFELKTQKAQANKTEKNGSKFTYSATLHISEQPTS